MAADQRPKASDKQAALKKLFPILKKQYKTPLPKFDSPILETMIHAICLENASQEEADAAQDRLDEKFHDYNEMRVSSISELNEVFEGLDSPDHRSLRIRNLLHYVFEENYAFEFEGLRRKTLELATKQLNKVRSLSPFIKQFTLQIALGSHVVPVDDTMNRSLKWLGLTEPDCSPEDSSDAMKSAVRKADGPLFCHLIRCLACDAKLQDAFLSVEDEEIEEDYGLSSSATRLKKLLESGGKRKVTKKTTTKKTSKTTKAKSKTKTKTKKKTKKSNAASTR